MTIDNFFTVFHIVSDFTFAQTQNSYTHFFEYIIFSCVSFFGVSVPVFSVTFNSQIYRRNKNINRPSSYTIFRNKIYSTIKKVVSYFLLNAGYSVKSITFLIAKNSPPSNFRVSEFSYLPTRRTRSAFSLYSTKIKTLFRAELPPCCFYGSMFCKKIFVAIRTNSLQITATPVSRIYTVHTFLFALYRTIFSFTSIVFREIKRFFAVFTNNFYWAKYFSNSRKKITPARTIRFFFVNTCKLFSTIKAFFLRVFYIHFITLTGAPRFASQYCCSGNTGKTGGTE